ncbi:MAG: glycosyltransferase family 2 protein [Chitinophagales bacterium]
MISIVMPIRNAERYLADCLNSILNQNFKNWELLAVNDHSTDETESILKKYCAEDDRITYFNNTGKGIIAALQLAYANSKGSFITRMDADDLMPSEKLETMYEAVSKNPESLITGKVVYIAEKELFDGYIRYEQWLNKLVDDNCHFQEIYKECVIASPCWMISRMQFEKCGAFSSNRYPEDYDLCFRFYENKTPVVAIAQVMHIWRDHSTRASRNDENYADNAFLEIKLHYFLKLDYNKNETLVVWGAGKKAKKIAQQLIQKNISFSWICNNNKKIGKDIYGKIIEDEKNFFDNNKNYQCIINIANISEQEDVKSFLLKLKNVKAFWFC